MLLSIAPPWTSLINDKNYFCSSSNGDTFRVIRIFRRIVTDVVFRRNQVRIHVVYFLTSLVIS